MMITCLIYSHMWTVILAVILVLFVQVMIITKKTVIIHKSPPALVLVMQNVHTRVVKCYRVIISVIVRVGKGVHRVCLLGCMSYHVDSVWCVGWVLVTWLSMRFLHILFALRVSPICAMPMEVTVHQFIVTCPSPYDVLDVAQRVKCPVQFTLALRVDIN